MPDEGGLIGAVSLFKPRHIKPGRCGDHSSLYTCLARSIEERV